MEKNFQTKALVIKADIPNENAVINMINSVIKEFGRIDVLGAFIVSREASKYMTNKLLGSYYILLKNLVYNVVYFFFLV